MLTTTLIILGFLMVVIYKLFRKGTLDVPGPNGLPLLGNILQIDSIQPYISLHQIAQKYGGIFKLRFYLTNVVVVNDYKNIHHVLVEKSSHFDGRPREFRYDYLLENSDIGLVDSGPEYKGRRKVVHRYVKQYGTGIERIEHVTNDAIKRFINKLQQTKCQPVDFSTLIYKSVTDVISVFLTGKLLDERDIDVLMKTVNLAVDVLKNDAAGQLLDAFPIIRHFPNKLIEKMDIFNINKEKYISEWIESESEMGFISYVANMTEEQLEASFMSKKKEQINVFIQFFIAGTFTTSSTLSCLANILCQNPSIQKILQKEVEVNIGKSRPPRISDRDRMPYLKAVIQEVSRFASILPIAIPHKASTDTEIDGYCIPKGTEIWINLWTLHHDDKFWDKPFEFCPERYLDDNGELLPSDHPNRKHTMPFGAGNRGCVGEILAQARLFLFIASLMQNFTILPETKIEDQPSYDPRDMTFGLANKPRPFKVRFQPL